MKKIFAIALLCFCFTAKAQELNYPSLQTVVNEFDKHYYFDEDNSQLELSKEPEGWYVIEKGIKDGKYGIINKQLFWSSSKKKFAKLKYQTDHKPWAESHRTNTELKDFILKNSYLIYGYERQYYFNYVFDDKHTIDALGNEKNLSDTLLEALARAYSQYCQPLTDLSIKEYPNLPPISDTTEVPENYVDTFIKYVDLGIETYERLYKQNPYYETIVGNIFIKYSNEFMYAYLTLCEWGYESKAQKYLRDDLYGEAFLSFSQNYLAGVEDNSIIFTNGDNDTYPLIYLQLQKGIKPNVHVLNTSLLNRPSYIKMIREGYSGFAPVNMSIAQKAYNNSSTAYVITVPYSGLTQKTTANTISNCKQFIQFINTNYNLPKGKSIEFFLDERPFDEREKGKKLAFAVNVPACVANNLLSPNETTDSIFISLNQFLYRSSMAAIDIIYNNNWQHSVYFSNLTPGQFSPQYYLKNTGILTIISPTFSKLNKGGTVVANDTNRLYNNLINNYSFNTKTLFKGAKGNGFKINASMLRRAYSYFNSTNISKEKLEETASKGLNIIPDSYTPLDRQSIEMAVNLAQFNPNTAEDALVKIVRNLYQEYKNPNPLRQFTYHKGYEKGNLQQVLRYLGNIDNMDTLAETLGEISAKIDAQTDK